MNGPVESSFRRAYLLQMARFFTVLVTLLILSAPNVACAGGEARVIQSAPTPEGWPELSPVGEVVLRSYPEHRLARAVRGDSGSRNGLFSQLFNHIKRKGIAMTAPVEMTLHDTQGVDAMAFLYRRVSQGESGRDGTVEVLDVPPQTFVSIGLRGSYDEVNFRAAVETLRAWVEGRAEWEVAGPARALGYNGPFTPGFLKFSEVQLPVRRKAGSSTQMP